MDTSEEAPVSTRKEAEPERRSRPEALRPRTWTVQEPGRRRARSQGSADSASREAPSGPTPEKRERATEVETPGRTVRTTAGAAASERRMPTSHASSVYADSVGVP